MNNLRRVLIVFDRFSHDACDVGEVLQGLPKGSKIIDIQSRGIVIFNPSFKITKATLLYPELYVKENEEGELIVDCSSVMEVPSKLEGKERDLSLAINRAKEIGDYYKTPLTVPIIGASNIESNNTFEKQKESGIIISESKVNVSEQGVITKRIGYKGTGNDIFQMTADEVLAPYQSEIEKIYTEIIKNQMIMRSPMISITQESDDMYQFSYPNVNPIDSSLSKAMEKECLHSWKSYEGFTNRYHYCEKCDLKKD